MANTPKHKLFFGIPYGRKIQKTVLDPSLINQAPPKGNCPTVDTELVTADSLITVDCDKSLLLLLQAALVNPITVDTELVKADTELVKIY